MAKSKKKKHSVVKADTKKKFNIKEYLPIIAIVVGIIVFVACFMIFDKNSSEEVTPITYTSAVVYRLDENGQMAKENVSVDSANVEKGVVEALFVPTGNPSMTNAVTGDVKVLSVVNTNGLCTVNLSEEFAAENGNDVQKEANAVYAIVNSLGMLSSVREVKINIEGDTAFNLGHIDLTNTFYPDWNMVRVEDRPQEINY